MSKEFIPYLCLGLIVFVAPLVKQPETKLTKDSKGVINSEFIITVETKTKSTSGLTNCTFSVNNNSGEYNKQLIGPCSTTEGLEMLIGSTYSITRANIDGGFININKGKLLRGPLKWKVIETYVVARTPIAKITNGSIVKEVPNNSGFLVDDYIDVN